MLNQSNYEILRYNRLPRSEQQKRVQFLNNTVLSLMEYHKRAKPAKRPVIERLIIIYSELVYKIGEYHARDN